METVFRLKASELDLSFIKILKNILGKNDNVEVLINLDKKIRKTLKVETKNEMRMRINKAIEETERGENLITFKGDEFGKYMKALTKK